MQKEMENKLGTDMMNAIMSEAMKTPEIRKQITRGFNKNRKH